MRAWWSGFALGVIVLQQQAALPARGTALAVLGCALCAAFLSVRLRRRACRGGWIVLAAAAGCTGFCYAAWRAELQLAPTWPAAWQQREIDVVGHVASVPAPGADSVRFLFAVDAYDDVEATAIAPPLPHALQLTWRAANGGAPPALEPGDRWRLPVRAKRVHGNANFGLRDTEVVLLAQGVRATGYVSAPLRAQRLDGAADGLALRVERWRARLRARIDAVLGDARYRGIVVALANGAQDAIADADWRVLRATGTSHLVAISGLHLALVAALAGGGAARAWRYARWRGMPGPLRVPAPTVALAGAALAAAVYAALAGFNVPVQRALWMLTVAAAAVCGQRRAARSAVLAWALGLVLLRDPWAVESAGFWLSFGAVSAILLAVTGAGRATSTPEGDTAIRSAISRAARRLQRAARVQGAVTLALAPLTLYGFAQLSLCGPLANAFAIPWVGMLVVPAVLAGVLLPAPLDAFALRAAHALVEPPMHALAWLSQSAWAAPALPKPHVWAVMLAAAGVAWLLAPRGWPLRRMAPFTWLPLLWPAPSSPPDGAFRLTALDVGQGTAVLIETAAHTLLFDAGPGPESTHAGSRIVVPYLRAHGIRTLDALVVSHDDADHAGGAAAVLDEIGVRRLVAGMLPSHPLWARASAAGAGTLRCAAGQRWQWDGVRFEMLWPDAGPLAGKPNAHSCVLRVANVTTGAAALLAADIEAPAERALLARAPAALRAQILVVPHHGSRTSSLEPFVDAVAPDLAIFQVGYLNRFRHPERTVFARYAARNIALARSDADGAVRVDVTRAGVAVERFRTVRRRYWMNTEMD